MQQRCHTYIPTRGRRIILTTAVLIASTMGVSSSGGAQEPRQIVVTQAPTSAGTVAGSDIQNLSQILDRIDWDPAANGPLLIVAPALAARPGGFMYQNNVPTGFRASKPDELREPGSAGYRLTTIDAIFGRKVTPLGSITALVPRTMVVLTQKFPPVDPYRNISDKEKQRLFLSSLTPAQWERLASPEGIGAGDLSGNLRTLFLSLLPDPLLIMPALKDGSILVSTSVAAAERNPNATILTPAQRASVRISARRSLSWTFDTVERPGGRMSFGIPSAESSSGLTIVPVIASPEKEAERRSVSSFGFPLREEVPNRPKVSDLDYNAYSAQSVSIAGATTVGELIARLAKATGLELYADPRYRDLPVYTRGESVRVSDLLSALSLSVTGTFRRVGESATSGRAYVLTDDRIGLAVRHARIALYGRAVQAVVQAREQQVNNNLRKANPASYLSFAADDPYRPDATLSQKIDDNLSARRAAANTPRSGKPNEGDLLVPIEQLPPAAQKNIEEQLANYRKRQAEPLPFPQSSIPRSTPRTDVVRLDTRLKLFCVVPGMGAIPIQQTVFSSNEWRSLGEGMGVERGWYGGGTPENMALPVTLPSNIGRSVLYVTANGTEEAEKAAAAARRYGLNVLCLKVSSDTSPEQVQALAKAAHRAAPKVALWVSLPPLRVDSKANTPSEELDRNLLGETFSQYLTRRATEPPLQPDYPGQPRRAEVSPKDLRDGDYLRPDLAAARTAVTRRLKAFTSIPEIQGLVLRDIPSPGYAGPEAYTNSFQGRDEGELGYSDDMRVAFLRQAGVDPLDLSPTGERRVVPELGGRPGFSMSEGNSVGLPLFPDYGPSPQNMSINNTKASEMGVRDAFAQWDKFRGEANTALFKEIQRTLVSLTGTRVTGASASPLIVWSAADSERPFGRRWIRWDLTGEPPALTSPREANAKPGKGQPPYLSSLTDTMPWAMPEPDTRDVRKQRLARILPNVERRIPTAPDAGSNQVGERQGIVLDLAGYPLEEALDMLTVIKPVEP